MPVTPKGAGARAGLPRPVQDHAISQNFHQVLAEIDRLAFEREKSQLPRFLWFAQVPNPDGTVNATVRIDDPQNLAGTLTVWVNKASYDPPDPNAPADGSAELPVTPATVLPEQSFTLTAGGTGALLQNIMTPAASGKRIFMEFRNEKGLSTGIRDFVVVGVSGPVTPGGVIKPGAITSREQFIAGVQPLEIVDVLPATCTKDQVVVLATDGKLYRCTGGAEGWVPVVRAPDLSGILTGEQLADEIINTAKIAQGLKLIRVVTVLPATGTADETVSMGGMLYTWDAVSLTWKAAAKAADLSGLIQGQQLVDAAISSVKMADRAVINAKIALQGVTGDTVAPSTILGNNIAGTTITGSNIFGGTIASSHVASRTLAADRIASNVLTTGELAAAGVHGDRITANTLHADRIVSNTITTGQIAAGAIRAAQIAAGEVVAGKLGVDAVLAGNIKAGEIFAGHIAAGQIDVGHIVAGGITAAWIAADAIIASKIQAGAIGVTHINGKRFSNPENTVGIAFADGPSATWAHYVNLTGTGYLIYSNPGSVVFSVDYSGNVFLKGTIEATAGYFSGEVRSDSFTTARAYFNHVQLRSNGAGLSHRLYWYVDGYFEWSLYGNNDLFNIKSGSGPAWTFNYSNSNAYAPTGGSWVDGSDIKLKKNVKTIRNALDGICQIRGVTFDWRKSGKHDLGVIAQEVREIFPELVSQGPDGLGVNYSGLIPVLIEAVKELRAEVAALKAA